MNSSFQINPIIAHVVRAAAIALAAVALFMLYFNSGSNPLLWALLLLPAIALKFIPLGKGKTPISVKSPQLLQAARQGRQSIAYAISIIAVIVPGGWLLSVATNPSTIGFPVLGSLFAVPILITGLVSLRNLLKQSQRSKGPSINLPQQVINGVILGIIGATVLLLIIGNLSF